MVAGLELADPSAAKSLTIDLLLGAETFAMILEEGLVKRHAHEPIAQKTKLRWIISGPYEQVNSIFCPDIEFINMISNDDLSHQVKRFWEIEEPPH